MRKNNNFVSKFVVVIGIYASVVWSWIFIVDATELTSSGITSIAVKLFGFLINVGLTTLIYWYVIRFLIKQYQKTKSKPLFVIKLFVVLAFIEWFTAWLLSFIWMGAEGSIDTVFPFTSLTPWLAYTPLVFLSRLVGFYGLSALLITTVVALSVKKLRRTGLVLIGIVLVASFVGWSAYKTPNGTTAEVATSSEKLGQPQLIKTSADLLVLPEYGLDNYDGSSAGERIQSPQEKEVFFIGSKQNALNRSTYNTLVFGSTEQGIITQQNKTRLVATSEYIPYSIDFMLTITGQTGVLAEFEVTRGVTKGQKLVEPVTVSPDLVVGAEVCSSIIAPQDYRRLTNEEATILTNSASLGVFGGSRIYRTVHNGMARFLATANARPFVQSAMDESAYILDHNGSVLVETEPVGYVSAEVTTNSKTTPYTLLGDWPVYAGFAYLAYLCISYLVIRYLPKKR